MRFLFHTLLWISFAMGHANANPAGNVVALGGYSNITTSMHDDPHQSGYAVTLFRRADGQLFGEFTYAPGTAEGFGGRLFDVTRANKKLVFKAKISAGQSSRGEPDRTLFAFSGTWAHGFIVGTLTTWNGYNMHMPVRVERVKLIRSPMIDMSPADYVEYLKYAPVTNW